ncbi:MAG: polysaccharide pyruvyl transferase family protein [Flavobacteriaceae bacterium]|nr:polysaccharide pyruvyl transferase family protein [Flavobacteriaceae bacterium]
MKPSILIKGNFSEGNFGDDALLLACHQLLTRLGLDHVSVYNCDYLYYAKDLAKTAQVGLFDNNDVELVLYAGGTQFFSFCTEKNSFLKKIKSRLSAYKWVKSQHSNYAMIGVGFGPFSNGIKEHIFAGAIIKKSSFTWVRDHYSFDECISLGIENFHLGADLCFLSEFQEWCNLKPNNANKVEKIGIVIRHWKHGEGNIYINKLIELSKRLKKTNYDLEFYLFSDKDDALVEDILVANKIKYVKWAKSKYTFREFLAELETCDLFVTARFHTAIFSTLMQKPFITVGLDQKLTYLSSQFDNECFNWYPDKSVEELTQKVTYVSENYMSLKENITKAKIKMETLSDNAGKLFNEYLQSITK